MSQVSWDAFGKDVDTTHQDVSDKVHGAMETGHRAVAREILSEYAVEFPSKAETLRLSLVRRFGTGL